MSTQWKLGLALTCALGSSTPALACDVESCDGPPLVLPKTENVPVNAFAFEVAGSQLDGLRLSDVASGVDIPASVKWLGSDQVWSPDTDLVVGQQVQLTYRTSCQPPTDVSRDFVVAVAASLDRSASLKLVQKRQDAPHGERHIYADISYQPPSSAESYLRLSVEVDGLPFDYNSSYGRYAFGELREQLWARCDYPPNPDRLCGGYDTVTARKHELKISARVLGQEVADTQTLSVDLRCDKSDTCQVGAGGSAGWTLLALLLRRRRR